MQDEENDGKLPDDETEGKLPDELIEVLNSLENNQDFNIGLEEILSSIAADNFDLSELQSKIMLLIRPMISELSPKEDVEEILKKYKKQGMSLEQRMEEISFYLAMKNLLENNEHMSELAKSKDKKGFLNSKSYKGLKETIHRFAVYELYKMANPRRIAGETRETNFVGNVLTKGLKVARKYSGGSDEEIKKYGEKKMKTLKQQRNKLLKLSK